MFSISLFDVGVLRVDVRALIDAGQEAGLPVLRFLNRVAAGAHGDEAGQILVLGAQAVGEPRAHAGADQPGVAAVHQQQRRLVVRHVGVHRADDADVVDATRRRAAKMLADFDAALAVLLELERRGKRGAGLALGRQVADRQRLAGVLVERGLGSNVSTCDGPPFMNRWMTRLALAGKCGRLRRERIGRRGGRF